MSFLRDLYAALIRTALLVEMQYRASNLIWLIGMVVEPLIYLVVWSAAATAQGGSLGGFGPHEFAAYYLVLAAV
ncbi:MAG TPA: ABC transporter permease, partial [Myxococcota bacterium]|nr:ABC transporter permease [Myxococcota bacterium]